MVTERVKDAMINQSYMSIALESVCCYNQRHPGRLSALVAHYLVIRSTHMSCSFSPYSAIPRLGSHTIQDGVHIIY